MNKRNIKIKYLKTRLAKLLVDLPEANLVKNRYRTIRYILSIPEHKAIIDSVGKDALCEFLKDVCFMDRNVRWMTEGQEKELKNNLESEKLVEIYS